MGILCWLCLLISGYSVLQLHGSFLLNLVCLLVMEFASFTKLLNQTDGFGCGFLVFGCFSQVLTLFFLCFLFLLGLKFMHFWGPSSSAKYLSDARDEGDRVPLKNDNFDALDRENSDCDDGSVKQPRIVGGFYQKNLVSRRKNHTGDALGVKTQSFSNQLCSECEFHDGFGREKNLVGEASFRVVAALPEMEMVENDDVAGENKIGERVPSDEDEVVDVITLRKMVKRERKRGDSLYLELEKERVAAASAAEETMAMLLRLQNEKSAAEMEGKQYKRIAEQKQVYDQEAIQGLQWMLMKHEESRSALIDKLKLCVQKLKMCSNGDGETDIHGFLESLVDGETDHNNIVGSPERDSDVF